MQKAVDNSTLAHWRKLDAMVVLKKLGFHVKLDTSFRSIQARCTRGVHVSPEAGDFKSFVDGFKLFDARPRLGGGGMADLAVWPQLQKYRRASQWCALKANQVAVQHGPRGCRGAA